MVQHFIDYIAIEKHYSDKTVRAYHDDIRDFCRFLGWETADFNPKEIDESDIKAWVIELLDKEGQAKRSVKRKLSSLHSFYRFLLRQGLVSVDITQKVFAPKVDKPLPVFFKESERKAATAADDQADDWESLRDCLIIQVLYQTGMRQAELLGLKDGDIDVREGQIRVFGKRKKERIIPIGEHLCEQIKEYIELRNEKLESSAKFLMWQKHNGEVVPMNANKIYNIVRARMSEVSTLHKQSPHVLRHTFATQWLIQGGNIVLLSKVLGHTDTAFTMRVYVQPSNDDIKNEMLSLVF